jgi:nucleotide-binding universal stress UspA family protein
MAADRLRIFHPTELTRECELAFAHAVRIARCSEASLTVMHVGGFDEDLQWEAFPSVHDMLRRWDMLVEDGAELRASRVEGRGEDVVRSILAYLDDHPSDLLVLATRGRRGFDAWFSGSVAEPVARLSKAKALFITHGCRGFVDLQTGVAKLDRVLVPVTAAPSAEPAIAAAKELTGSLGVPEARVTTLFVGEGDDAPLVGDLPMLIRVGNAPDAIAAAADEIEADLIVMTTEGRHGVVDAFRGSTTEQVVRRAPCPVLAVPVPVTD